MTDIQKINRDSGVKKSSVATQEDWNLDDEADLEGLESDYEFNNDALETISEEDEGRIFNGDDFQKGDVTIGQIHELQTKASSFKDLVGQDEDLLKLLDNLSIAEHNEHFQDAAHQEKASQLYNEALALSDKLSKAQESENQAAKKAGKEANTSDIPDEVDGDTAKYNSEKNLNPKIDVFGDPKIQNFVVHTRGTPTIVASSFEDKVEIVTKRPSQDKVTIKVTKFDNEGKAAETKTLIADYELVKKIKFEGFATKKMTLDKKPYAGGMNPKFAVTGETKDQKILDDVQRIQRIIQSMDGGGNGARAGTILSQIAVGFRTGRWDTDAIDAIKKDDGNDAVNLLINAIKINYAVQDDSHLNIPVASISNANTGFGGAARGGYELGMQAAEHAYNTGRGYVSGGIFNFDINGIGSAFDVEAGNQGALEFLSKLSPKFKTALIDKTMEENDRLNRADGIQEYYQFNDPSDWLSPGRNVSADTLGLSRNAADSIDFINRSMEIDSESEDSDIKPRSSDEAEESDATEETGQGDEAPATEKEDESKTNDKEKNSSDE